jgi:hypothetical protein
MRRVSFSPHVRPALWRALLERVAFTILSPGADSSHPVGQSRDPALHFLRLSGPGGVDVVRRLQGVEALSSASITNSAKHGAVLLARDHNPPPFGPRSYLQEACQIRQLLDFRGHNRILNDVVIARRLGTIRRFCSMLCLCRGPVRRPKASVTTALRRCPSGLHVDT